MNRCSSSSIVPFSTPISAKSAISSVDNAVFDLSYFTFKVTILIALANILEIGLSNIFIQKRGIAITLANETECLLASTFGVTSANNILTVSTIICVIKAMSQKLNIIQLFLMQYLLK